MNRTAMRNALFLPVILLGPAFSAPALASVKECLPQVDSLIVEFELPASPEFAKTLPRAPRMPVDLPEAKSSRPLAGKDIPVYELRDGRAPEGNAEPGFGHLGPHAQPDRTYEERANSVGEDLVMPSIAPILPEDKHQALVTALYAAREADAKGEEKRCRDLLAQAKSIAAEAKPRE